MEPAFTPLLSTAARFELRARARVACRKVGLDRPLIPTAFVANLFRLARVSRPRRFAVSFGEGLPTPPFGRPNVSRRRTDGRGGKGE